MTPGSIYQGERFDNLLLVYCCCCTPLLLWDLGCFEFSCILLPCLCWCTFAAAGAVGQPMGKRPCATGFAVEVANTLLQASDASVPEQLCPALASLLDGCAAWKSSIAPDGAIHRLLKQQDGQLCGPPPPRPAPSVGSIEEDTLEPLGLSNLLNDADLTAFLAGRLGPGRLGAEL